MVSDFLNIVNQEDQNILSFQMSPEIVDFHTHKKAQLTLIEGGLSYLHTRDTTYFIPSYHYVWIPPNLPHKFSHQQTQHVLVRNLFIPISNDNLINQHQELGIFPAHPLLIESLKFAGNSSYQEKDVQYSFLSSLVQLLPILSPVKFTLNLPNSQHHILKPILKYITDNPSRELRLTQIADRFNIGARTLSRLFENEMHSSFIQYIKTVRIIKSIELILTQKMSVSEIAYAVGYKSIAAFSNTFLQTTGKRPSEFGSTLS